MVSGISSIIDSFSRCTSRFVDLSSELRSGPLPISRVTPSMPSTSPALSGTWFFDRWFIAIIVIPSMLKPLDPILGLAIATTLGYCESGTLSNPASHSMAAKYQAHRRLVSCASHIWKGDRQLGFFLAFAATDRQVNSPLKHLAVIKVATQPFPRPHQLHIETRTRM